MDKKTVKKIRAGIRRVKSAFEKLEPNLEEIILKNTAVAAYHRPPINEEDGDIEKLRGLIFPVHDLDEIYKRLAFFPLLEPDKAKTYIGVDIAAKNPGAILAYGFQHLEEAPQKILQNEDGSFYLTQKPLLSSGNWAHPLCFYIFDAKLAVFTYELPKVGASK